MENLKYRIIYEYEFRGKLGRLKSLKDGYLPHELTKANRQTRVDCCVTLLNRHNNEGILNRIITCYEKWILYDNRKCSAQWLDPGQPAKSCPKRKLTPKKLLVSVWWTSAGIVHCSFLKSGQTITADVYCQQLQTMMEKLAAKQPRLVNRSTPLLLHDNAGPHTTQQTATKLEELQLECIRHPPYSPDLAPTDYHFFRNLDNFLQGKKFNCDGAVQIAFTDFINSRPTGFFSKGINELPMRWQKCI
ncbi:unnamed protein product [Pieris macdunnoughi]|uniref:Transposase n=1 Tax=Pieris macdunnoughi TaxID=345717 RepID=A0A821SIT3_9NEOP|nr:unnamed protein product [Pieris macdunnoughi]